MLMFPNWIKPWPRDISWAETIKHESVLMGSDLPWCSPAAQGEVNHQNLKVAMKPRIARMAAR